LKAAQGSKASHPVPAFDVQALAQSIATIISQTVVGSAVPAPPVAPVSNPVPPLRGSSIPKINDLPKFTGFGIDGADATSFLLTLEDLFDLHQVQSAHHVILVGQTFPHSTPAIAWYQSARAAGSFEKNGILNWNTLAFCAEIPDASVTSTGIVRLV
jgi:hypothetical protein